MACCDHLTWGLPWTGLSQKAREERWIPDVVVLCISLFLQGDSEDASFERLVTPVGTPDNSPPPQCHQMTNTDREGQGFPTRSGRPVHCAQITAIVPSKSLQGQSPGHVS